MKGKWRITKMPAYTSDYPDMVEPAYILFNGKGGGEFAFGCVTGAIREAGNGDAIEFSWTGHDEMDEASGDGWAELQTNGSIIGQICFHGGDEADFTAHPWKRLLQQPARRSAYFPRPAAFYCNAMCVSAHVAQLRSSHNYQLQRS